MARMELRGTVGVLTAEVEQIEVTSALPQPDKTWKYVDQHGHRHYWEDGYPTLARVVDEIYWCDECGDDHTDSHLECPVCHERIEPDTYVDTSRQFMPGRTAYYLDGEPITPERFAELRREYLDAQGR